MKAVADHSHQRASVSAEAIVNPSESQAKVMTALSNIVKDAETSFADENRVYLKASGVGCLETVRQQLRERQVRGVARRLLLDNRSEDTTWIYLNKQAAFIGKVALCDESTESPLGPITLTITSPDLDALIDWLSPKFVRNA